MSCDNICIVIPTKDRPLHLIRCLKFLAQQGFGGRIKVLDSSDPAVIQQSIEGIRGIRRMNIDWVTFPPDMPVPAKMHLGAADIREPYISIVHDDDMIQTGPLTGLEKHLTKRPEAVGACGEILNVVVQDKPRYYVMARWPIENPDPIKRMRDIAYTYQNLWFGLYRAKAVKEVLHDMDHFEIDFSFYEPLLGFGLLAHGDILKTEDIFYIREIASAKKYVGITIFQDGFSDHLRQAVRYLENVLTGVEKRHRCRIQKRQFSEKLLGAYLTRMLISAYRYDHQQWLEKRDETYERTKAAQLSPLDDEMLLAIGETVRQTS